MKHLIISREYPPAPSGGIGTYVLNISELLAKSGETVHVISQLWEGAEKKVEEKCAGRLIVHRIPYTDWTSFFSPKRHPSIKSKEAKGLFESSFFPQCFSWQASLLAENLIEQEGIDIIEAQDFEAPLYYFQLRRALGLGPKKHPPCIVHLHSPTEFIAQHNDWDMCSPSVLTAKRLEDYSIGAADVLLCPSRYLARQMEAHHGLVENTIRIIPYPIGDIPILEKNSTIWRNGTICYVGRLERRKGVLEWIEAAVNIAPEYPMLNFEFIGADIFDTHGMSVQELMQRRIPKGLKRRFHFRGEQKRSTLPQLLANARIAVVPSRWENFPYACIEAMCSGIPVIVSQEGGMAEMIEDGKTGWLARKTGSKGLADALKRAIQTPSKKIAVMGNNASSAIRRICNNEKIVERQLNFRSQIVGHGPKRSLHLPVNLTWTKRPLSDESIRRKFKKNYQKGLAIVITCFNSGQFLDKCLQSIEQQTIKPLTVVIVDNGSTENKTIESLKQTQRKGWKVINRRNGGLISAKNACIKTVLNSKLNPLGFIFLSAENCLQPGFVAACESVFRHCKEVGLVSCWTYQSENENRFWSRPCPSFPHQWLSNEAAPFSAVRTEALLEAGNFRTEMSQEYDNWDLFNAVMAGGWFAVTIPEILGFQWIRKSSKSHTSKTQDYMRMRRELLGRFPELISRDGMDIILLTESIPTKLLHEEHILLRYYLTKVRMIIRSPGRTGLQVLRRTKNKILRRTPIWMSNVFTA